MVLLIPDAVRKIKAQGKQEERQRINAAFAELGIPQGNGAPVMVPLDEIRKILNDDAQGKS